MTGAAALSLLRDAVEGVARHDPGRVALCDEVDAVTYGELAARLEAPEWRGDTREVLRVATSVGDAVRVLTRASEGASALLLPAEMKPMEEHRAGTIFTEAEVEPDAPLSFGLATSGSSGMPKVVELDWPSALANARSFADAAGYRDADTIWSMTPLAHLYALGAGVLGGLLVGATVLVRRLVLDGTAFARIVREEEVSVALSVPYLYRRWLDDLGDTASDRSREWPLRASIAAGEPVTGDLIADWRELTGAPLHAHYGLTEGGHVTLAAGDEADGVGPPLADVEVKIGTDEQVRVRRRPPQRAYRILGRSPEDEGWCDTGDLGEIDARGNLVIGGRADSRLNVAGKKIDPAEIEETLRACAGVEDCAVAQLPAGDAIVAFVRSGADPLEEGALRERLAEQLSTHKVPRRFVAVEEIPRTLTGKVRRGELLTTLASNEPKVASELSERDFWDLVEREDVGGLAVGLGLAGADPSGHAEGTGDGSGSRQTDGSSQADRSGLGVLVAALARWRRADRGSKPAGTLAERLAAVPEAEREPLVLELVRAQATAVLGLPEAAAVDPERPFSELGFDSLGAVELRNRLARATGLRLPATLAFDHPTPAAVVAHLMGEASVGVTSRVDERFNQIEAMVTELASGDDRSRVEPRLRALTERLQFLLTCGSASESGHNGAIPRDLESASDDEVLELIDKEFGPPGPLEDD